MSGLGKHSVGELCGDEAIVEVATPDYLECLGVEEYFQRCTDLGIDHFSKENKAAIARMKDLKENGRQRFNYPTYLAAMKELMAKTFGLRYEDIANHSLSVRNAVAIYPGLLDFQELRREFERITGKSVSAFESHLDCVLKKYVAQEICKEYYTCTNDLCRQSLEILHQAGKQDNDARVDAARIIIFACAQSEKTWWDVVFKVFGKSEDYGIGRPHPTVLVHGTPFDEKCADVYCEQIKIVGSVNFYEAILTCYFLYYVFHLNFPPVDLEIFQSFEDLLLKYMSPMEGKAGGAAAVK